jgi:hypothetical protein
LLADGGGVACQQQEGGLEAVLGRVLVEQHAAADAQHQRAVPPHQGREGVRVVAAQVGAQQVAVGLRRVVPGGGQVAQVPEGCPQLP